jgi:hypothetical protein
MMANCITCGRRIGKTRHTRIDAGGGDPTYQCPACQRGLPRALDAVRHGEPVRDVCRRMGILTRDLIHALGALGLRKCHGPCGQNVPPANPVLLHPISGDIWCLPCLYAERFSCRACMRMWGKGSGVFERQADGTIVFICRACRTAAAVDASTRCSSCNRAIGPGFISPIYRHPADAGNLLCHRCLSRLLYREARICNCSECDRSLKESLTNYFTDSTNRRRVCRRCYSRLTNRITECPECKQVRALIRLHPERNDVHICNECTEDIKARKEVGRIRQEARSWPPSHQKLLESILAWGDDTRQDFEKIKAFCLCQPGLVTDLDLSVTGIAGLVHHIQHSPQFQVTPSQRSRAAKAVTRGGIVLHGEALSGKATSLAPTDAAIPGASDLVNDLIHRELPSRKFAYHTILLTFWSLRRFFRWTVRISLQLESLDQIKYEHLHDFILQQDLTPAAQNQLRDAWCHLALLARIRGLGILCEAPRWGKPATKRGRFRKVRAIHPPKITAVVYANTAEILERLDAFARNANEPPMDRMLAHLLFLAGPSRREIVRAEVPDSSPEGAPPRRSLVESRRIVFPPMVVTQRRAVDYRRESSSVPYIPLRTGKTYMELYRAVDRARADILKGTDSPYLFPTSSRRASLGLPLNELTTRCMLQRVAHGIGYEKLKLGVLRNSVARFVADTMDWEDRTDAVALAAGRSHQVAASLDLAKLGLLGRPLRTIYARRLHE